MRGKRSAQYEVVRLESTRDTLVIRDVGPHDQFRTITNDAEAVVAELFALGLLESGRRLLYYDSSGDLDELVHQDGAFHGFKPGYPRTK
jgi:hypothetical protein